MPGAEIVDCDTYAEPLKLGQGSAADFGVPCQGRLGDLEFQPIDREPAIVDALQGVEQRRGVAELPCRQIDRDPLHEVPTVKQLPGFELAHRLAYDPAADIENKPA